MKKHERSKTNGPVNSWRLFGSLFLSILLLFTVIATATDTEAGESSAGGQASATGDVTTASVHATTSESGASSSATAKAVASDGGTATAMAETWASISGVASAYAQAVATTVAGIGETVYAYAHAEASVSSDGTATASTIASVGQGTGDDIGGDDNNGGNGDNGNNGNNGENGNGVRTIIQPIVKRDSMGGFIFGKGATERYCTFMSQLDDNDSKNDDRARYFMNIIAWNDFGLTEKVFEQKYGLTKENCTQIVSNMTIRMEAKNHGRIQKLQSYYTADSTSGYTVSKGIVSEYSVTENIVSKDIVSEYSMSEYPISGDSIVEDTVYYE